LLFDGEPGDIYQRPDGTRLGGRVAKLVWMVGRAIRRVVLRRRRGVLPRLLDQRSDEAPGDALRASLRQTGFLGRFLKRGLNSRNPVVFVVLLVEVLGNLLYQTIEMVGGADVRGHLLHVNVRSVRHGLWGKRRSVY